jgi:hypothetical protein
MADLPVHHHHQNDWYLCGAACAQMIIEFMGAGLMDQRSLYEDRCHDVSKESFWLTSPNGLQETLMCHKPPALPITYAVRDTADLDTISRKLVWTVYHYRAAPAILVGGSHWIVVRDFMASAMPRSAVDTTYKISAFFFTDPASDLEEQHEAYATDWHHDVIALDGTLASKWKGRYIAVCDSDPAPRTVGKPPARPPRLKGDRILVPDEARQRALGGLQEYQLPERESWKASLKDTHPGTPILVQRLDRRDAFYYIVPMVREPHAVPVLACVDGRFGTYLQAGRVRDPHGNALRHLHLDPQWAKDKVLGQRISLGPRGTLQVRPEGTALHPALVWRPCRESMSPYLPFFMFVVGSMPIYLRVDGRLFTKLHTNDHGI